MSKKMVALLACATFLVPLLAPASAQRPPDPPASDTTAGAFVLVVTTTDDEVGPDCTPEYCSLRQAIAAAHIMPGPNIINFSIPVTDTGYNADTGQWTIQLESMPLYLSDTGTVIDARYLGDCDPLVVIDATGVSYGFEITGTNHSLSGLVIKNATQHGVYIRGTGTQNNQLTCSYVVSNTVDGVRIGSGAMSNTIGTVSGEGNVIAGNGGDGVHITASGSAYNRVLSNTIGISITGSAAWANGGYGVRMSNGAVTNTVRGNLISGNTLGGVLISKGTYDSQGNVVRDNRIGTNAGGTAALPNKDGVVIAGAAYNTIGPDNLISGNERYGIHIHTAANHNTVQGNDIGTNAAGTDRVSNEQFGLVLQNGAYGNTIGGTADAHGNVISGNGYDGDYPSQGGIAILDEAYNNILYNNAIGVSADGLYVIPNGGHGIRLENSAHHNTIGALGFSLYGNAIAWNEGDGIFVHGISTRYNTIGGNSIHDNDGLGINTEAGGNRQLSPPQIIQYTNPSVGYATLYGRTCLTCTVQIYSDDGGEGRQFEGNASINSGRFYWQGLLSLNHAFTMIATDADGNSSEFSAAPVTVTLSIDDALPHVIVNKLPADADGPAVNTTVEFVATVISQDPSLRQNVNLDLKLSAAVLGAPVRVFTRSNPADYNGVPVTWSSPSSGEYRVTGLNLISTDATGPWSRQVVFRFAMPPGTSPQPLIALAYITATGRTVSAGADLAGLQILKRAGEVIVTNRTQLYNQYTQQEVTTFLQNLYSFAQGPPANWSPSSVIYYVDTYSSTVANWDNRTVSYASETAANTVARIVDSYIEDWVEDSPTIYQQICSWSFGCHDNPADAPFLMIAGDDSIIPLYRKLDPTDKEQDSVCPDHCAPNTVLSNLRNNNYFFTDNYYADLSYVNDDFPWNEGGVELATGRLVGSTAADLSTLLRAGQYGPNQNLPARAIVASWDGRDADEIATHLSSHGYNVLNDGESPVTVDSDSWAHADLVTLLQSNDYQILQHADHATEYGWSTPTSETPLGINDIRLNTQVISHIIASRPVFVSNGCRSGLAEARPLPANVISSKYQTFVNVVAGNGASALVASTGISFSDDDEDDVCCGEEFVRDFWSRALRSPSSGVLSLGAALRWNKRYWDGHWSVDDVEEKTGAEFVLYGVPWVTVLYRGTGSPDSAADVAAVSALSPPQPLGGGNYMVTATFDASGYFTTTVDGFDLVHVPGMVLANDLNVPVVPLAISELQLPLGGSLVEIQVSRTDPLSLGTLNIPQKIPAVDIPGGDPGGYAEAPEIGVYPPQDAVSRTVVLDGHKLARVYASPLSYDTVADQADLYQSLTVSITYHLSNTIGLLDLAVAPGDLAPGEPFTTTATLVNAGADPVPLTGTLTLENSLGQVVGVHEISYFEVPGGGAPEPQAIGWTAPITEGAYSLFLALWSNGSLEVAGHRALIVSGGRITGLTVPQGVRPGEETTFGVTFDNRRGETFAGHARVTVYTAQGAPLITLDAPFSATAKGTATVQLPWDTVGVPGGPYVAAAVVERDGEETTYGVVQENFMLHRTVFLPLVLRNHP